jgi:hypothetical protein
MTNGKPGRLGQAAHKPDRQFLAILNADPALAIADPLHERPTYVHRASEIAEGKRGAAANHGRAPRWDRNHAPA